jgi:hypothetical protein
VHFDGVTILPHDELAHDVVDRAQHIALLEVTGESANGHGMPPTLRHNVDA